MLFIIYLGKKRKIKKRFFEKFLILILSLTCFNFVLVVFVS